VVPTSLLLVRGRAPEVRSWARHGLLPVWVVPDPAWTLVVPAGEPAAAHPYDDPVAVLGGRPVPSRLRPCICLVVDGPRAVVAVQQRSRRAIRRWMVWGEGAGLARVEGLPLASTALVAEVVGLRAPSGARMIREVLAADGRRSVDVVEDLLAAAGMPGGGLMSGQVAAADLPDAARVEPAPDTVERFDQVIANEARLAAELEEMG
jgi:hypothetical protein